MGYCFQYIKGKTLAQLMEDEPDKKDEYLEMFVNLQLEVQSKTCTMLNKLKDNQKSIMSIPKRTAERLD